MTDEISLQDTERGVVDRDSDGDLIPEEHKVEMPHGDTKVIKTKPITTGLLNELSNLDDAIADLEPKAVHEAFQTVYVSDPLLELSVDDIRDTRAPYLNAYLEPLNEAVEEEIGNEEGNPIEMDRGDRAREMRQ